MSSSAIAAGVSMNCKITTIASNFGTQEISSHTLNSKNEKNGGFEKDETFGVDQIIVKESGDDYGGYLFFSSIAQKVDGKYFIQSSFYQNGKPLSNDAGMKRVVSIYQKKESELVTTSYIANCSVK